MLCWDLTIHNSNRVGTRNSGLRLAGRTSKKLPFVARLLHAPIFDFTLIWPYSILTQRGPINSAKMTDPTASSSTAAAEAVTELLPPSRVARNLELHLAAEAGDLALVQSLVSPSSPSTDENDDGGVDVWYEDPSSPLGQRYILPQRADTLEIVKTPVAKGALGMRSMRMASQQHKSLGV